MNVSWLRLKPLISELRGIRQELARMAECWETELSQQGINMRPPKADTSGPDPTISYTAEDEDWIRENIDRYRREDERKDQEDV